MTVSGAGKSEDTASRSQWERHRCAHRRAVLGLAALEARSSTASSATATTGQTGYGTATTKPVYIYNSASQGGIKTSLNAGHRTGNALGQL